MNILLIPFCCAVIQAADPVDFVRDVRPIFEKHCYECHSENERESGLRLDVKKLALKGGDNYGPDIVPGNVNDSPLIHFITSEDDSEVMPPDGKMTDAEIEILKRWISEGAVWPDGVDRVALKDTRDHWSFKALKPTTDEKLAPASSLAIDIFIETRLAENKLTMSPAADRASWLRRVSFDLIGLPPTPEQVREFVKDDRSDAFERVVEELLNSERYGERWAQHWLDLVRYADTHGFEVNTERPNAWPYRDYVIRAFNKDTPYDQFIREQIVGDAMGEDAATGFLVTASVLLPGQIGQDAPSMRLARQDSLDEIVNNIGQTFLGLSVGCARCHDHKFDPITAKDYYAMQAFVAGVEYEDRKLRTPVSDKLQRSWMSDSKGRDWVLFEFLQPTRTAKKRLAQKAELEQKLAQIEVEQFVFAGRFRTPDEIRLLLRGDPEQPQEVVSPAMIEALDELSLSTDTPEQERRRVLANWIADPANPLTARVMVNRIWQGHFGSGLVQTPSDFGNNGMAPTHPELLDWLAKEFIRSDWSIKHMHRLIVLSKTYRQSSKQNEAAAKIDSDVQLLWRYPSRRVEAEAIRDSMLAASGLLDLRMYGPGFDSFDLRGGLSGFKPIEQLTPNNQRRMIYAHKVRRQTDAVFGAFDCPDGGQSAALRSMSTTPIQALNLFNSQLTLSIAKAFADRVKKEAGDDLNEQVQYAYQLALNRDALSDELQEIEPIVREHGIIVLCRVLFNSNEFLFIP